MLKNRTFPVFKLLIFIIVIILPLYSILVVTPLFTDLIYGNQSEDAEKSARHLSRLILDNTSGKHTKSVLSNLDFEEEARKFLVDFEILKIKIFSTDGTTIYSTHQEDIGEPYPNADFWAEIANGEIYSKIVKDKSYSIDDEFFHNNVIETYYPLIKDNTLIGAIEIYTNVAKQQEALTKLSLKQNLMVLSILLLLGATYLLANEKEKKHLREQQKSQNQILNAKKEWEKTFDAVDDAIAIIDLSYTIQRINKAGRDKFKADFNKLVDRKCFQVLENSDEICPDCPIPKVLNDGKIHHSELLKPNDKTLWISIAPLFGEDGHINGFVHTARDISRQKRMEQQMQRSQRRESLAVLTKGIAHNFRNILASILMNSQVLQSNHSENSQINEITGWINDSVQAGSRLVTRLMQFSQHKRKNEFQLLDLAQLIPDTYDLVRSSVGKNISLTYDVKQSLEVMGDPGALFQVLADICSNSDDAMPEGGDLQIKLIASDTNALMIIEDTGCGIEEDILDKIFEPFFTTKEIDEGTGLGLSSSYGIIKEHGGNIKVESTVGVGTTVTITLPLTENFVTDNQLTSMQEIEGLGQKIMVVDDDEQAIIPIVKLLDLAGYQTTGAKNCEEALIKLEDWHPDLVILDYNMHGKNGIECATEINHLNPSVKIIILSGSAIEDIKEIIAEQQIEFIGCCLEKPASINKLSQAIEKGLNEPTNK